MVKNFGLYIMFFFSSRRRHTRCSRDWSSDVCSSDLEDGPRGLSGWFIQPAQRDRRRAPDAQAPHRFQPPRRISRSEERRVGKECRSRWSAYHYKKKEKGENLR